MGVLTDNSQIMSYLFEKFSLDPDKFELKKEGKLVSLEPQVFLLLKLLVENSDRMISKDEIIREIWDGKFVTDASISNRIKFARIAVGDDGKSQNIIRTVHGQGFRFVAEVFNMLSESAAKPALPIGVVPTDAPENPVKNEKPSIVVLPFQVLGGSEACRVLADAVPHDLIQALSRLRWLFVIARGSAFRFRSTVQDPLVVGKSLGVKYLLAGSIEDIGTRFIITTELSDAGTGGVIWAERFEANLDDIHQVRAGIASKVTSSFEVYIPLNEAGNARLSISENLDSWSNFHLGLQHMYRFTQNDNEKATGYFQRAVAKDPRFSRAHAGLSFTSFQSAFLKYSDPQKTLRDARQFAERAVELDPFDPFANFTMGRYFMLQGNLESSVTWLDRAISLNPNYSQGLYSHAFTDLLSGQTTLSLPHLEKAISLSPLDPLAYAMLAARSLSYAIDGEYELAAESGQKAARLPGAHFLIDMIALIALSLNQDQEKAQFCADNIRIRRPDADQGRFFASFPFSDPEIKNKLAGALARYGF